MLVTFTSSTSGEIMMFAETARRLFEIISKTCSALGVITEKQLPEAIEKLQRAVLTEKNEVGEESQHLNKSSDDEDPKTPSIGLAQRAYPLIELMERTRIMGGFVMWRAAQDFGSI